jgi:CheY-like chemotaxis protein
MPKVALVVDDESSVRAYVKTVLENSGYQTLEAADGIHGLEIVRKIGLGLDLVVSDINMPEMDGINMACLVRDEFPAMPIVLISGYAHIERQNHPEISLQLIQKPFLPTALMDAVMEAKHKAERASGSSAE